MHSSLSLYDMWLHSASLVCSHCIRNTCCHGAGLQASIHLLSSQQGDWPHKSGKSSWMGDFTVSGGDQSEPRCKAKPLTWSLHLMFSQFNFLFSLIYSLTSKLNHMCIMVRYLLLWCTCLVFVVAKLSTPGFLIMSLISSTAHFMLRMRRFLWSSCLETCNLLSIFIPFSRGEGAQTTDAV